MANVFKNALAKNVGTSPTTVYTAPASKKAIIIELDVCNTTLGAVTTSVYITSGGQDYYVVKNAPVPVGGSLQVISGQKIVLTDGDLIKVLSSSATSLDVISSILEDV
jgi:hypothetical protein